MRRLAMLPVLLGLLAVSAPPIPADPAPSRPRVGVAPRSDRGDWYGSWAYANRDQQFALFIRESDGLPQLKLRFRSRTQFEEFETGWDGEAAYLVAGREATFHLRLTERDAHTIRGEWDWQTWLGVTPLREQGRFTMYRALDGRKLVMDFEEVERAIGAGDEPRLRKGPRVISFTKVSKRVVLWEEVY